MHLRKKKGGAKVLFSSCGRAFELLCNVKDARDDHVSHVMRVRRPPNGRAALQCRLVALCLDISQDDAKPSVWASKRK